MATRLLRPVLLLGLSAGALGLPASPAAAASSVSSNWAGYAATPRAGATTRFRRVSATWVVRGTDCVTSAGGSEVSWVGIGGYDVNSTALEQAGTAVDCSASGRASYYAWYELVPAPVRKVRMKVHVGDRIAAGVAVRGTRVTLRLHNETTGRRATRIVHMSSPDTGSAEWIAEAPSGCDVAGDCQVLPLADFGGVRFTDAGATTVRGHTGAISDPGWARDSIALIQGGPPLPGFAASQGVGGAIPSRLSQGGQTFTVRYRGEGARAASARRASGTLPATRLAR